MSRVGIAIRAPIAAFAAACLLTLPVCSQARAQTAPEPKQQTQPAPAAQSPQPQAPAPGAAQPDTQPAQPPLPPAPPPLSPSELQDIAEIQRPIAELKDQVEQLGKSVERNSDSEEELQRLRGELVDAYQKSRDLRDALLPKSEALKQQIEKLGPAPAKDAAPESAEIATERARLNAIAAEVDGSLKSLDVITVRTRQLRDTVQAARQALFATHVLQRSPSPLAPATWIRLAEDVPSAWRQVREAGNTWAVLAQRSAMQLGGLLLGVFIVFAALTALVRVFLARRLDKPRDTPPSFFVQAATVGWVAPLMAAPALAAVSLLRAGLDRLDLLTLEVGQIAEAALPALFLFIAVSALTHAIFQPKRPAWRLLDLSTPAARRLARIITGIAAVFALDIVVQEAVRRLYLPLSINVMEMALASIAIAVLLIELVRTPFEPKSVTTGVRSDAPETSVAAHPGRLSNLRPYLIKLPVLIIALTILVLSLAGYIGLGRFITMQIVVSGSAIAIILVLHLAIRAFLGEPGTGVKPFATVLNEQFGLDIKQGALLTAALSAFLNIALALAALPLVLVTWGYTLQEVGMLMRALVFGFQIGEFRVSLVRILLAVGLFVALVLATRITQRWIDKGITASKRFDQGVANSIHTAVGYTGFIVAALAAISYGGLDVTNFAIVAGALSVGIGFGLQSIINNFVSGLILLVERPIKVGDRVAVKGQEGFVRRISVRSTEIETFDKASLIVPNSDLITSSVTNWTHRNALGAATVKVRVGYHSDAEQVRSILLKVASECPLLMQHPAPTVVLENFGESGLEFSLGAIIPDVSKGDAAKSDLRFRILKAFREARIEMPYAQYDVHLRDLDLVKMVMAKMAEDRARQAAMSSLKPEK